MQTSLPIIIFAVLLAAFVFAEKEATKFTSSIADLFLSVHTGVKELGVPPIITYGSIALMVFAYYQWNYRCDDYNKDLRVLQANRLFEVFESKKGFFSALVNYWGMSNREKQFLEFFDQGVGKSRFNMYGITRDHREYIEDLAGYERDLASNYFPCGEIDYMFGRIRKATRECQDNPTECFNFMKDTVA